MTVPIRANAGPLFAAGTTILGDRTVVLASVKADATIEPHLTIEDGLTLAAAIGSARQQKIPFVGVLRTTGVPFEEGIGGSHSWATAARELVKASGAIPTVLIASGPVVSGPALLLGLADVVIFTEDAYAYVTGPKSVEAYTGVPVSGEDLGGTGAHLRSTGVASLVVASVDEALEATADVLAYLPDNVDQLPEPMPTDDPGDRPTPEAGEIIPATPQGSYDVRDIIRIVCDDEEFLELRAAWAPNMVTGFATFGGHPVGIVANQTQALAGSLDIPASQKGGPVRGHVRRLRPAPADHGRHLGLPPGQGPGVAGHDPPRGPDWPSPTPGPPCPGSASSLRKSYGGAYIVMDSKQHGQRPDAGLALGRGGGHGGQGGGRDPPPHRSPRNGAGSSWRRQYEAQLPDPLPGGRAGLDPSRR